MPRTDHNLGDLQTGDQVAFKAPAGLPNAKAVEVRLIAPTARLTKLVPVPVVPVPVDLNFVVFA